MKALKELTGVAAPMPMINVDTDMIIPKQYLKTITRDGLGKGLFHSMRYNEDGSDNPDFVLNKEQYKDAAFLIAGDNFGCGSSREHAAWALEDFGIQCVVASSFSDIFYNNAFKNGMLLIKLPQETIDQLTEQAEYGSNAKFSVDVEAQILTAPDGSEHSFDLDEFRKHCLINGLDEIALTLEKEKHIESFENSADAWLTPAQN